MLNADIWRSNIIEPSSAYLSPALGALRHDTDPKKPNFIVFSEGLSFSSQSHSE